MPTLKIKCPNCGMEIEFEFDGTPIKTCPICGGTLIKKQEDNFDFEIVANTLTKYKGGSSNVTIPEGVTKIGYNAFADVDLIAVNLPSTLKVIDYGAFRGTKLSSIILNEGLERIEKLAFADTNINELALPKSLVFCSPEVFDNKEVARLIFEKTEILNKECGYYFPYSKEYVINGDAYDRELIKKIDYDTYFSDLGSNKYDFDLNHSTLIIEIDVKSALNEKLKRDEEYDKKKSLMMKREAAGLCPRCGSELRKERHVLSNYTVIMCKDANCGLRRTESVKEWSTYNKERRTYGYFDVWDVILDNE